MDDILQNTIAFAARSHGDQRRKYADELYINHPIRVMQICREYTDDITVLSAALLHDVLEDTKTSAEEIDTFLQAIMKSDTAKRTLHLVVELTDIYTKRNYPQNNRRQRKTREAARLSAVSAGAQTIKYADIIDNSLDIVNAEPDFARIFLYECRALVMAMKAGNSDLRGSAAEIVERQLQILKNEA